MEPSGAFQLEHSDVMMEDTQGFNAVNEKSSSRTDEESSPHNEVLRHHDGSIDDSEPQAQMSPPPAPPAHLSNQSSNPLPPSHLPNQKRKYVRQLQPIPTSARQQPRKLHRLEPVPARVFPTAQEVIDTNRLTFYDLPVELRLQIYALVVVRTTTLHILPLPKNPMNNTAGPTVTTVTNEFTDIDNDVDSDLADSDSDFDFPFDPRPHPLTLVSRLIRAEAHPVLVRYTPIRSSITNFDFRGLLTWLDNLTPASHKALTKNTNLNIRLHFTQKFSGKLPSMRTWLHHRADPCRLQPRWKYSGPIPDVAVRTDLRRRFRRMNEEGKRRELRRMAEAIDVTLPQ